MYIYAYTDTQTHTHTHTYIYINEIFEYLSSVIWCTFFRFSLHTSACKINFSKKVLSKLDKSFNGSAD